MTIANYTVIRQWRPEGTRLFIAEVIQRKGILLFWIATPHFIRLAMTRLLTVITRATPEVIYSIWIASLTLAMTKGKIKSQ